MKRRRVRWYWEGGRFMLLAGHCPGLWLQFCISSDSLSMHVLGWGFKLDWTGSPF